MEPSTATPAPFTLIRPARLIDGRGGPALEGAALLFEGAVIRAVGPAADVHAPDGAPVEIRDYPDATLLPGLIDAHTHLNGFGDGRVGDDLATLPDEVLLLQAARNARAHLAGGVTTLRDCGSKGRTSFGLRQAAGLGIVTTPRLVLCGRPITITGGHLWYFGAEADGTDAVRHTVRQLIKEGADFIKLTATGGSTRTSFGTRPSYSPAEVRAIVEEAQNFGKPTAAHSTSTEGVRNAVEGGVDTIVHCVFNAPDGTPDFRPEVAEALVARRCWVDFTIAQSWGRVQQLENRKQNGASLSQAEVVEMDRMRRTHDVRREHFRRLLAMGVRVVSGSDSSWAWYPMGRFADEVIAHEEWGMSAGAALLSGTRDAAECLGVADQTGTLEAGKAADLLVVDGDPLRDINDLRRTRDVFLAGRRIVSAVPGDA